MANLDTPTTQRHRVRPGLPVMIDKVRRGLTAEEAGLMSGNLIRQVGDGSTPNQDAFLRQMAKSRLLPRITVLAQLGHTAQYLTLGPE